MTTIGVKARRLLKSKDPYRIPVPRRSLFRRIWRIFMRLFTAIFLKIEVRGRENFPLPGSGPVILVSNHNAFVEIPILQAYAPYPLEFLTTGDIPLEPRFAFWAHLYGFIPVKRGSMDRKAMAQALSVLEQGGVIALFPQGGIWETKVTQAHTGVAWLSQKGNAVVVPVGIGGTAGAFKQIAQGKRPVIEMIVGKPIPVAQEDIPGMSRKEALDHNTGIVMQAVFDLIPQWEKDLWKRLAEETFTLKIEYSPAPTDTAPVIDYPAALCKFFHRPVLLDAMRRNLELNVGVLEQLATQRDAAAFAAALGVVIEYVTETNPYFLTYRFGNQEGHEMQDALKSLQQAALWAAERNLAMNIQPMRRYRMDHEASATELQYPPPVGEI